MSLREDFVFLCRVHGASPQEIRSPRRFAELVVLRRSIACRLRQFGYSLHGIGRVMRKDHSTVYNLLHPKSQKKEEVADVTG